MKRLSRKDHESLMLPEARRIMRETAARYGLRMAHLMIETRVTNVVRARWEGFYRMREELKLSFPHIAKLYGGMDHSTVMHGYRKFSKELEEQKKTPRPAVEKTLGARRSLSHTRGPL